MKQIKRQLHEMIRLSLNGDQINYIAEQLDGRFNLHTQSGFSKSMSIPAQVAADTILDYFKTEEELIKLFEVMMGREGVFLFGATIKLAGKQNFINLLAKKRWVYDTDLKQFFRDPFYQDTINFLDSIRLIDLRQTVDIERLRQNFDQHSRSINDMNLDWSVSLRMYGIDSRRDKFLRYIVEFLLSRQKLEKHTFNVYSCLRELAVNASKANYKYIFTKERLGGIEESQDQYHDLLDDFKYEIEEHGDNNLIEQAQKADIYFDVIFKSNPLSFSIWVCNYIPISKIEKERLVYRLKLNHFDNQSTFDQNDDFMEGAGLGLNLIMKILEHYGVHEEPIKAVFYPDATKIGFVLSRENLLKSQ